MGAMTIERIEGTVGFEKLREEWDDLLRHSASDCLFLTWEWLYTWWKHFSEGRSLCVIAVRSGRELVAIAPLALRPRRLGRLLPLRSLEFLGTGSVGSNYLDVIIRRGREEETLRALADSLGHGKLMLDLAELRGDSCMAAPLAAQLAKQRWGLAQAKTNICPFIKLAGHSWDSYLATLGQEYRYYVRRVLRKLANQVDVHFEQVRAEDERAGALAQLVSLHSMRWRDRGGTNAFHTPGLRAFHEEFSRLALERGWLRLFVLRLGGKPVAALYGFMFRRTFYFYQSGFDPGHGTLSLGTIMLARTIRSAIEEGADEYDLLGGDERYKIHWAHDARELWQLELYPPGARGWLCRRAMVLRHAAKRTARRLFPQALVDRIAIGRRIVTWKEPYVACTR